jgi:hypothetical protein
MECIVLDDKEMDIQVDVLVGKDRSPEVLGNDTSMEVSGQQGVMSETRHPSH